MGALSLLEKGQKEWESDHHPFVEVIDYKIWYHRDWIVFAKTSTLDEHNQPPIPIMRVDGHVKVKTDNGCIFNHTPQDFERGYRPFVRVSGWERLDTL